VIKPYYQDEWVTQYCSDALKILSELEGDSIDLLATDPPYGISFMGKEWDRALPNKKIWQECLRVSKPGAFAFVMSIPRSDCLSRMIISLEDAGFRVDFTPIYWTYASGFPKAQNIGRAVDKRFGAEREVVGRRRFPDGSYGRSTGGDFNGTPSKTIERTHTTTPATPQAKALDGSYGGFQPKPAVEVIIVAMKPLSEKTFVDQALKNQKGITWLDDCRIPYESEGDKTNSDRPNCVGKKYKMNVYLGGFDGRCGMQHNNAGRFPANLLCSDDVLNDGEITSNSRPRGITTNKCQGWNARYAKGLISSNPTDSGSFSRYFDLDKWWAKTFPFLIVPKASKSEKNKGLGNEGIEIGDRPNSPDLTGKFPAHDQRKRVNHHPTVKPLKLMSYLITLGSREGDTVLDPFMGSGTTMLAGKLLNRHCIGIEIEEKYCEIAAKRCSL